ncbi:MAG: right-handed parallel beta-helix repeat-containing protein [Pontiellaceae bacterium]|nr:right-handed parallel beta-helix repeat-containing protein [Pontiellaceae bacterium]
MNRYGVAIVAMLSWGMAAGAAEWGAIQSGTTANLNDVEYIDGMFVACGDNGTVLTSADGLSWSEESVTENYEYYDEGGYWEWDESLGEEIWIEGSGEWVSGSGPSSSSLTCVGHIYGSLSVLDDNGGYYSRTDGDWVNDPYQTETFPFNDLIDASWMAFAAGTAGNVYLSDSDFQSVYSGSSALHGIASDGGESSVQCVAVGADDTIVFSYDGWSWEQASVSFGGTLWDVAFGGYQFAAVGDNGGILITLSDLGYWVTVTSPVSTTLYGVANGSTNGWLAVGAGGTLLCSSDDLSSWSEETSPTTEGLNAVCYGNGRFVAVGDHGTIVTTGTGNEEPNSTPVVTGLTASPNPFLDADTVSLSATASSTEVLVGAEYFLDAQGVDGEGTVVAAADDTFDQTEENLTFSLDVSGWADDEMHMVYLHAQNQLGEWSDYVQLNMRQGASFVVPRDYATIQAAINAATAGDVIQINAGTYNEAVTINKAVTLMGVSADSVFINGQHQNIPVTISGNGGVTLQNITCTNAYLCGIKINENADGNVIEDCEINMVMGTDSSGLTQYTSYGIWAKSSDDLRIERTVIQNIVGHKFGNSDILAKYNAPATGIYLENSHESTIRDCVIEHLSGGYVRGIYLFNDCDNTFPDRGIRVEGGRIADLSSDWAFYGVGSYGISADQVHDLIISGVEISNISCTEYDGWYPNKNYDVEGVRIDDSKRVEIAGCSFYDLAPNGRSDSPHAIHIMGSNTSDTIIGGSTNAANAFGVNAGYNVYNSTASDVDATYNYWPVETPDDRIYDELDYGSYGRVDSSNALQDTAPEFTSTPINVAYNGANYEYEITVNDSEGDVISIVAGSVPAGFSLEDRGDGTAVLSGTPLNEDIGQELWVSFVARSGPTHKTAAQYFDLTIKENTFVASRPSGVVKVGEPYRYTIVGGQHEPFGALHYSIENAPDWLAFDAESGVLSGTPEAADVGTYSIELACTDDSGWTVMQSYSLSVVASSFSHGFWSDGVGIEDVVLNGSYAYAEALAGLHIIDISEPTNPSEVAFLAGVGGDNVAVDGSRVAVSYNNVFGIVDVSSTTNPVLQATYSLESKIVQLRYENDRVYAITDTEYLYIVDAQDPLNVSVLYSGYHGSYAQWSVLDDMDVEGNLLGIVDGYDMGLQLFDITDPANPVSLDGLFDMWGGYPRIDIEGDDVGMTKQSEYAVFGAESTVSLPDFGDSIELRVVGDLAYVASTAGGLNVIQSNAVAFSYSDVDFSINALDADAHAVVLATETGLCVLQSYGTEVATPICCGLTSVQKLTYGPVVDEKTYSTEWCTNLVEGVWTPFVGVTETNETTCTVTLPEEAPFITEGSLFFRVRINSNNE